MIKFIGALFAGALFLQAQEQTYYPASSYSNDRVREMFQGVEFTDPNVSIVEIKEYRNKGTMVLEFGDVMQLEDSLDQQITIRAKRLYFSYVPGRKSISYGDESVLLSAFKIVCAEGVVARGILRDADRQTLYFPKGASFGRVLGNFGRAIANAASPVKELVKFFYDRNRDVVFSRRTEDAADLYASALDRIEGKSNRDHQVNFDKTYLDLLVYSDANINYLVHQVISSSSDIIVIAPSLFQLKTYIKETKIHEPIRLLMPNHQVGVYSAKALTLATEVSIKSKSDLLVLGDFYDNYSLLRLRSGANLYGAFDAVAAGLSFSAQTNLTLAEISKGSELLFYEQLSPALYAQFVRYLVRLKFVDPKDELALVNAKNSGVSYNQIFIQRNARNVAKSLFPGLFEDG